MLLGVALREKIISNAKETEWINKESFRQLVNRELENFKLKEVVKFHLGNSEISKIALDSLAENLKSKSEIVINNKLLKNFILI